jgi:hypothetical protein
MKHIIPHLARLILNRPAKPSTSTHVEPLVDEDLTSSIIEPRVELVDDTLVPDDGEQPASDRSCRDDSEDGEPQEGRGVYQGGLADLGNGVGELDLASRRSRGWRGGHGWATVLSALWMQDDV